MGTFSIKFTTSLLQMELCMQKKKTFSHYVLLSLLSGLISIAHVGETVASSETENADEPVEFILGLALTTGGDELAEVYLSDDGDISKEEIEAGGFTYFYGGMQFDTPAFPMRFTLGYFTDTIDASNGSVSFSRVPLELLGVHTAGQHSVGMGLTYHLSPELDMSDFGLGSYDADNALGLVLMYEYTFESSLALGVRYTNIDYDFGGVDIDGNNLGILMEMKF
jgi:hypothetical protein